MKTPPRELKTDWPDGTKFAFCAAESTPFAFVPVAGSFYAATLPDGSTKPGGTCAGGETAVSREEFDRLADVWVKAEAPPPRALRTDWPPGTEFRFCGDDETPLAFEPSGNGMLKVLLPDGSPRHGFCDSPPGPLTREEFDKLAAVWAL